MTELLQRVGKTVSERHLLAPGQKILAAVSGGVDSMVLLYALHSLAKKNRWQVIVAHFNHRLRGRASDADATLVRRTAAKWGLKFVGGSADVKQTAAQLKVSIEMAARKLRHEFLACAARQYRVSAIAVAHHADDQVELFFLRLLRGAGGQGLAGMKWRSPSPADKNIFIVRPLLEFFKADLLAFARENKIRFRDDATNFSPDILRNRIRSELLPLLREKYQPGLDKTVLRLMDIVGAEAEFAHAAANNFRSSRGDEALNKIAKDGSPIANFAKLSIAVQRQVLQQQLMGFGLLPDFDLVEQLRSVPGREVSVCAGLTVFRDAAGKVFCREQPTSPFNDAQLRLKLSGRQGRAEFAGQDFRWQLEPMKQFRLPRRRPAGSPPPAREIFDADKVGSEIILRHWQPGDRFQPIGLKSAAKLQDLFVNAKIPAARRRELVLATNTAGEIFWVDGLRIGEHFKLTPETLRKLVWQSRRA